jgi:cystathionine beta-lyase
LESPGSLTFEMQDIPAIVSACKKRDLFTVLDNTWATPLGFRAFDFDVDVSVHAATKFIGGHSDLLLGLINCNEKTYPRIKQMWRDTGVTPSPDDCFLALRGLRTLSTRLSLHEKNGLMLAEWIKARPEVSEVFYPALPDDPGHLIWKRDYQLATGVFSFVLRETRKEQIARFFNALTLIKMGWSWGGFTSLITFFEPENLRSVSRRDFNGTAIRLAVGLEHPVDLIADLTRAFEAMSP